MRTYRRPLRYLNVGRTIAVTTLLVAAFTIEVLFVPQRPLHRLYLLGAGVYGAILFYAMVDRWKGDAPWAPAVQIAGDTLLVSGFVLASGGAMSPVSFLFALPLMLAAAVWGTLGGTLAAGGAWCVYGLIVLRDVLRIPAADLPPGRVLYAAVSHLIGFMLLGILGGVLADRVRAADREIALQKGHLATLRAQHAQIVESINTGLLTTDETGRVTFVNRAGVEVLRLAPEEMAGRPVSELLGLSPDVLANAEALHRAGRRCRFERRWKRPATAAAGPDEELLLGFAIAPLRSETGGADGWLVVFQDLTEIASLEAQVRTRERMAALGEMAAGMAHELRNPLAAISGCVQVLGTPGGADEKQALVEVARRETERLNRIIRDFLEFARPGPLRPRPVDLLALFEEMARLFRKSPDFTPAHTVEVAAGPGSPWAMADADRMRQVFWNLAGNALKAMPGGGTLRVEVGAYAGDGVMVSFRDQGEGMDEETLARLFQPFHGQFREGAGLGTAIVYRIAEEHHGQLQVLSRPQRGTEIRMILPAAAPAAQGHDVNAVLAEA